MTRRAVDAGDRGALCLLALAAGVALLLPIAISHQVHRGYSLPRHLLVLLAAPVAAGLSVDLVLRRRLPPFHRGLAALLLLELTALAVSAGLRAQDLQLAVFGSFEVLLGLASHLAAALLAVAAQIAVTGSSSRCRWLLRALAGAGFLIVVMGPCQTQGSAWRWAGAFGHANYSSHALLVPLFAAIGLTLGAKRRWEAALWAIASAAMAVVLCLLQTRGAWLAASAGGCVILALLAVGPLRLEGRARRLGKVVALSAAVALLVLFGLVAAVRPWRQAAIERVSVVLRLSSGSSSRVESWRSSPAFLRDHLLLGTGPGGFRNAFLPYKSEALGRSLGREQLHDLHSLPLQALAESGIAGLAAFLGLAALGGWSLWRVVRAPAAERQAKWGAAGLLAGLTAHFVHGLTIGHVVSTAVIWHVAIGAAVGTWTQAGATREAGANATTTPRRLRFAAWCCSAVLFAATAWYGVRVWRADHAMLLALSHGAVLKGGGEAALAAVLREGRRAVELAPEIGEYHLLLAATLAEGLESPALKDSPQRPTAIEAALAHAEAALRQGEKKENATLELARLHWLAGRADRAELDARAAIAIDRHFFQSHRILALLLLARGQIDEARQELHAVERLSSGPEVERLRKLVEQRTESGLAPPAAAPAR